VCHIRYYGTVSDCLVGAGVGGVEEEGLDSWRAEQREKNLHAKVCLLDRFRAKWEQFKTLSGHLIKSQGQNLSWTVQG